MKSFKLLAVILLLSAAGCSKVPAGHVGVKVHLLGGAKGVDAEQVGPGRYWLGINEEMYLFPTFTQNYTWTADVNDGSGSNEELGFQTVEGLAVKADVGISYSIKPDSASAIFQKYRRGIGEITDVYLRNMVRDALVKRSSTMPVESVYGEGKSVLIDGVQGDVARQVADLGIVVEKVYWIGELRLPDVVAESINAKIKATQLAQQRKNEIAQARAEADKAIEDARGKAESALAIAKAEALAIEIKGSALKNNPQLLELSAIEKWDGKLPVYSGSSVPFVNLEKATQQQ